MIVNPKININALVTMILLWMTLDRLGYEYGNLQEIYLQILQILSTFYN